MSDLHWTKLAPGNYATEECLCDIPDFVIVKGEQTSGWKLHERGRMPKWFQTLKAAKEFAEAVSS